MEDCFANCKEYNNYSNGLCFSVTGYGLSSPFLHKKFICTKLINIKNARLV
jgi:hypothetical protein